MMDSVEDAYPLNAVHSGILFHSLQCKEVDVYLSVISLSLHGELNVENLQAAWQQVFAHHPSLRSSVMVDGLDEPLWVVHKEIEPIWKALDFSRYSVAEQEAKERELLNDLEQTRFEFASESLMKFTLVALGGQTHRLLWTIHHLISDGWSTSVILEDLATAYAAHQKKIPVKLPPAMRYREFLDWQAKLDLSAQNTYWEEYLTDRETTPLVLTEPTQSQNDSTNNTLHTRVLLEREPSAAINDLARKYECTSSVLLLAAWALVLRDLCQQDAPLFGVTVAGRPPQLAGIERSVGLFIATLPLCIDTAASTGLRDWLHDIGSTLQNHAENDALPLARIQKLVKRESNEPLFNSVVAVEGHDGDIQFGTTAQDGVQIDSIDYRIRSHFDVSLLITTGIQTQLHLITQSEMLDASASRAILDRYKAVLSLLVNDECDSLKSLHERSSVQWQQSRKLPVAQESLPHRRIDQWILHMAQQQPDANALVQGKECLTYAELVEQATCFSRALLHMGGRADQPVALCLPNSSEAIVAMLGVFLARRFYVPLDPQQPKARRDKLCIEARCSLLISVSTIDTSFITEVASRQLENQSIPVSTVATLVAAGSAQHETAEYINSASTDSADDMLPAYLMYTSGSTGTPKGVLISHSNLIYSTQARFNYYSQDVDSFLLVSPLHFDSSIVGIYWTLCSGGTLVLPEQRQHRELSHWQELIKTHKISHMLCLPDVYGMLLDQAESADLDSLATVIVAGEVCRADLCATHYQKLSATTLYNEYGPTEACVWSSVHRCQKHEATVVPIGQAIPGTVIEVVGIGGARCPDGVEGELQVFGSGVANGYYNRPDLTQQSFLTGNSGYRTGDLGYRSRSGDLIYTGRIDRQIKVRGQRIELAEIEAHALRINTVLTARVFAMSSTAGSAQRLWLAYTPADISEDTIRIEIEANLPDAMWPRGYLALDSLPLLSNGKVAEQSLTELARESRNKTDHVTSHHSKIYDGKGCNEIIDEPQDADISSTLLKTVNTLLGTDQISAADNLLQCGMDSIDAMKLTARLRSQFEVDVRLATVLESANCGELAEHIRQLSLGSTEAVHHAESKATELAAEIPLSAEQSQLWFLEQIGLAPEVYAVQSTIRYKGCISQAAIEYALNALVHRHEVLRTRFHVNSTGEPRQVVHPAELVPLNVIEQRSSDSSWGSIQKTQLQKGFDLTRDQLLRAVLYRETTGDCVLMFHSHHLVMDGWSFRLLHTHFAEHYTHYLNSTQDIPDASGSTQAVGMPVPDQQQYREFARWQAGQVQQPGIEHWCRVLAQPRETLDLPLDFPRPKRLSFRGASISGAIEQTTIASWSEIANASKATLFMVALAAVKTGLRNVTGNQDLLIGTPMSNREDERWHKTLGFFSNPVVIRTNGTLSDTLLDSVSSTRAATLEAQRYQTSSLADIIQALKLSRPLNRHPLFEVLFVFQNKYLAAPLLPGVASELVDEPELDGAKFDLAIEIRPIDDASAQAYELHLNYNRDLFSQKTIERLHAQLLAVMAATAQAPNLSANKACKIQAPNNAELKRCNEITEAPPQSGLLRDQQLYEVFQYACNDNSQKLALSHGDINVDYGTLNLCVQRIANSLLTSGVQAGDVVAATLPRSIHQLASALAVWQCNAVWCPIDSAYPAPRKHYILSDSTARFLFVDSADSADNYDTPKITRLLIDLNQPIKSLMPIPGTVTEPQNDKPLVGASTNRQRHSKGAAALIYTSGSTGNPKGVLLGHRALMNRFVWMWTSYPYSAEEVSVIKTSCSFVDSLWESFGALLAGVPSVLVDDADVTDMDRFPDILRRNNVTRLLLVPSLLSTLLDHLEAVDEHLPNLKLCSCSGELLPVKLAQRMLAQQPQTRLLNLYGSTEIAADVTCHEVVSGEVTNDLPLGVAISGVELHILDDEQRILPAGETGEIAFSGRGLAIEYHGDTELTKQKYIHHTQIGRTFLTGDRGRLDKLGRLRFIGRKDRQVKVRGIRIDCHEVEQHLQQLTSVVRSHVFVQGELDDKRLCAVIEQSADAGNSDDARSAQQQLKLSIPAHQIPDVFVFVDELPELSNGKIDRAATMKLLDQPSKRSNNRISDSLKHCSKVIEELGVNSAQPDNTKRAEMNTERADVNDVAQTITEPMMQIWRSTLRNNELTVDDDFFDVGGYSLLAVKLVARINQEILAPLEILMSIGDLLEWRCVSSTVLQLDAKYKATHKTTHQRTGASAAVARPDSIMTLQRGTGEQRVFIVPPFGQTGFFLQRLASALPSTISVHSFDTGCSVKHETLKGLSTEFVNQVLELQPDGPWVIAGLCYGNVVAFEMAQQLKCRTGFESDLYLVDGSAPLTGPGWEDKPNSHLGNLTGLSLYWVMLKKEFQFDYGLRLLRKKTRQIRATYDEGVRKYVEAQLAQSRQYLNYCGVSGSASINFIRSSTYMNQPERVRRWELLTTGSYRTFDLPSVTHLGLMKYGSPHMDKLAPIILQSRYLITEPDFALKSESISQDANAIYGGANSMIHHVDEN